MDEESYLVPRNDFQRITYPEIRDKESIQIVIAIRPFPEHIQPQIHFDVRVKNHCNEDEIV